MPSHHLLFNKIPTNELNRDLIFFFPGILNFEKPPIGNKYFNDSDEGILCDCLPECHRVDFSIEVSPIALS